MSDELLDIYDLSHNHIGTAMRSEVHAKGLWHNNINCWIFDPVKKLVVFQLRSKQKSYFPDKFDISVAGHVGAGEDIKISCVREVGEELGIECTPEELQFIGIHRETAQYNNMINCEYGYTYLLQRDVNIGSLRLQPEEVAGAYVVPLDEAFKLFAHEAEFVTATGVETDNPGIVVERRITSADFIPFWHEYMISILVMMERVIEGKKYIGIG